MDPKSQFRTRLIYWSKHAFFCATPSFLIALVSGYSTAGAVCGMLAGVMTFIWLYTFISSRRFYTMAIDRRPELHSTVHSAAMLRSFISGVGLLGVVLSPLKQDFWILCMPDFYAGLLAVVISTACGNRLFGWSDSIHGHGQIYSFWSGTPQSFFPTYLTTLTEGVILSGTLLVFVILLFIPARSIKYFSKKNRTVT